MNEQDKFDFHKYDFLDAPTLDPYLHAPINQYDLNRLAKYLKEKGISGDQLSEEELEKFKFGTTND